MYLMLAATYLSPRWGLGTGVLAFLHTFRPAGAFKGWCAVRTLQMYFSNRFLSSPSALIVKPIIIYTLRWVSFPNLTGNFFGLVGAFTKESLWELRRTG